MGKSIDEIIASLPSDQQGRIEVRFQDLVREVEGLRALRQLAGKAQSDIAAALNIRQPSVSKIERQADMYLSTLRSYVEAVGGRLDLVVTLPERPALHLRSFGEASDHRTEPAKPAKRARRSSASAHGA